ncbi:low-density lipoprotein receptor-related protein 2-like [Pomacea canaliculata]|uniref:low-density lipoprotein receptor-related protein 2-like n=1 Tax=Pomacea canaliculata TaxID=400727 RepID=UPI000D72A9AC|nr:low-density lipoprotein receptor-related protein 2-like [Pomacea canaliculata]
MWQGVPCVFMFDCNDREAEGGCWQGDGKFKQGIFQVDGSCLALLRRNQPSSWYLDSEWCQKHGGQLLKGGSRKHRDIQLPVILTNEPSDRLSKCVDYKMVCDDKADCDDYADENLCNISISKTFSLKDFNFTSTKLDYREGRLLLTDYNMSDMSTFTCPVSHFMCASLYQCVDYKMVCDHKADCDDYADEIQCYANLGEHNEFSFQELNFTSTKLDYRDGRLVLTDYNMYDMSTFTCPVSHFMCASLHQLKKPSRQHRDVQLPVIVTNEPRDRLSKLLFIKFTHPTIQQAAYIRCPANHFTHVFLACDDVSSCWSNKSGATPSCSAPLTPLPPSFKCGGEDSVPYTLVCDHRPDCKDRSDEDFCVFAQCASPLAVLCSGRKCVDYTMVCNDQVDCDDYADENLCHISSLQVDVFTFKEFETTSTRFDYQNGRLVLTAYNMSDMSKFSCPVAHFMCARLHQVCLPVFLRCNGLYDCPDHEDEAECDRYTCPGFYRCRQSQVCVDESHVCDGVYHCPQRDDELLCNDTCPHSCVCYGLAFICSDTFRAADYSNLRYLDGSGTLMTLADLWNNTFLVHLSLVRSNLTKLHELVLPNLRTLDLSYNELTKISGRFFAGLNNIVFLKISNNPLTNFYNFTYTSPLKIFDMSDVKNSEIDFSIMKFFSKLANLNLSGNQIKYVTGDGFPRMMNLQVLDLRKCPLTHFPKAIFQALDRLESVFADNYKLCCPATLPKGFNKTFSTADMRGSVGGRSCPSGNPLSSYDVTLAVLQPD